MILCGILPCDKFHSLKRTLIIETNQKLKTLCETNNFVFLEPDEDWILPSGMLNKIFYWKDHMHLNQQGNEKLYQCILKQMYTSCDTTSSVPLTTSNSSSDPITSTSQYSKHRTKKINNIRRRYCAPPPSSSDDDNDDNDYVRANRLTHYPRLHFVDFRQFDTL